MNDEHLSSILQGRVHVIQGCWWSTSMGRPLVSILQCLLKAPTRICTSMQSCITTSSGAACSVEDMLNAPSDDLWERASLVLSMCPCLQVPYGLQAVKAEKGSFILR